ncbi:MAG: FCD domain-containing protein [Pararobbsia sp.]
MAAESATARMAGADSPPARGESLTRRACEAIRAAIRRGELAPGDKLNEARWASRLGVSRGPVREAFRTLEQAGLLEMRRNRGVFVRSVSEDEAEELHALRAVLEGHACRMLAERLDAQDAGALHRMLDEMDAALAAGAPRRYAELDRAFHELIVSCAGNRKLYRIHAQMSDELLLCPPAADRETGAPSSAQALAGHRALVTALASRDGEGAARILQAHLAASTRTAPDGRLLTRSAPYPETSA